MLYLRICFDRQDGGELRAEVVRRHREYVGAHVGASRGGVEVVQAGPMSATDDLSPSVGSFLVVEAPSIEDVRRFHDEDPFTKAGLFASAEVVRWDRHIGNPQQTDYAP